MASSFRRAALERLSFCVYPTASMRAVTKLFLSNRSQAVRIPAHLRLPDSVKEVEVRACGQERIIAPLGRS